MLCYAMRMRFLKPRENCARRNIRSHPFLFFFPPKSQDDERYAYQEQRDYGKDVEDDLDPRESIWTYVVWFAAVFNALRALSYH